MGLFDRSRDNAEGTSDGKTDDKSRLKRYRDEIKVAQKWRADHYDDEWREFIQIYANRHLEEGDYQDFVMDNRISVAISFSTINIIYPSVSIARPKITVTATREEMVDIAETVEAVVNYWWRHYDLQDEFRQAVKDYLVLGHGWLKTTYLYREEQVERDGEAIKEEIAQLLQGKYMAIQNRPQDESLFGSDEEIANGVDPYETRTTEDRPLVERVSPFDMIVDPDATRLIDARWIAQRISIPISEAKKKKDWNQKVRDELIAAASAMKEGDGYYDDQVDKDTRYVIYYEHYDLENGVLCLFGDHGKGFLKEPEQIPYSFGHPFVMIRNYEVPECFYPLGELECLRPLQLELDFTRSAQLRDLLGHVRKYVSRKGMFDQENIERMASRTDGEMILAEPNAPDNLNQALIPMPEMTIPQQTFQMSAVIQDDMTRVSGVSDYALGAMPEMKRTATEAGIIQDAANARAAEKLAQIEIALARVARRVVQLGQQYLTVEQVARVHNDQGEVKWVQFDRDTIQGEFDFEIEAGSTQPQNDTFRRQSALQMMDVMAPFMQPTINPMTGVPEEIIDKRKLAEHVLRYGFGVKNANDFLVPPPPPPMVDPMTGQPMMGGPPMGPGMEGEMGAEGAPPQPPEMAV
jgi:hypothetical protein